MEADAEKGLSCDPAHIRHVCQQCAAFSSAESVWTLQSRRDRGPEICQSCTEVVVVVDVVVSLLCFVQDAERELDFC